MTDLTVIEPTTKRGAKVPAVTAKFIFIGDPNDNGAASRAPQTIDNEGDDPGFVGCEIYGIKFPKGNAVEVPLNAVIADTDTPIVRKLRGNRHFFEGTEDELKAARSAGEVKVKPAPKKEPVYIKNLGVRGLKQSAETAKNTQTTSDGDDD